MTSFYKGIIGPKIIVDVHRTSDTMTENKHQHDGRYQVRDGFIFDGVTDQGDYLQLKSPATFTFQYRCTRDEFDWYHVDSEEHAVHCTMRTYTASFPSLTNYFTRLGDVSHAVPETSEDVEDKHRHDGRYRAKKNYRFVGTTGSGVEVEVAHPDEFDFEYAGTIDGVDWYGVKGPDGNATVKLHKNCIPGVASCFEKIRDLVNGVPNPVPEDLHQHDGTYRVKPRHTFVWRNCDGVVVLVVGADSTFTVELLDYSDALGYKYHVSGSGLGCHDTVYRDSIEPYLDGTEKISDLVKPFEAMTAPAAPKKEDTLDTTYKSLANASAMLKNLQPLLVFDVATSNSCTLRAQCFRGCRDPRAGTLRIDVPSGHYRCTVCGVQGPDAEHLVYTVKAHRATTVPRAQESIMNTSEIKHAFDMTNHKAAQAVKVGAEQAGAHAAHEVVIDQVEKLLGARFPTEFYATEIGRAVISMGSAYALLLTTQMVQHPLASKANHVAELALTAATYESAGPLLAKAREFVEGTVVAAMGAGVDLGDK